MRSKIWFSFGLTLFLFGVFTVSVAAQQPTPPAPVIQIQPVTAVINQQIPVSLTLRIAVGATGTQTVTLPVFLNLNIRVGLASPLSPTVGVTVTAIGARIPITVAPAVLPTARVTPTTAVATAMRVVTTAVPGVQATSTPTATPIITATATPAAPIVVVPTCPDQRAAIFSPGVNQVVTGTVTIEGSATHESFQYYKLEYKRGSNVSPAAGNYNYFAGGSNPVPAGVLGVFDSTNFPNGAYTLLLTVVDKTSNFPSPCPVTVLVEN